MPEFVLDAAESAVGREWIADGDRVLELAAEGEVVRDVVLEEVDGVLWLEDDVVVESELAAFAALASDSHTAVTSV